MAKWEYCMIFLDPGYVICVAYYRTSGVEGQELAFDRTMKEDFDQWKRETGQKHGSKEEYLRDRLMCQLLADGWDWWQYAPYLWQTDRPVFEYIFRKQVE